MCSIYTCKTSLIEFDFCDKSHAIEKQKKKKAVSLVERTINTEYFTLQNLVVEIQC